MVETPVVKPPTIRLKPDSDRAIKWIKIFGRLHGIPVRSTEKHLLADGSREIEVYELDNSRLEPAQRDRLVEFYTNVIGFMFIDARDFVNNGAIPITADDCEVEA